MATRLLLFRCGGQVLAVEADAVREILPALPATRIPGAAHAVRGLVNVRGTLVPVVDAAAAAGLAPGEAPGNGESGGTVILVERNGRAVGLVVEEVLDLVSLADAALDAQGALPGVRADLVRAVGTAGRHSFVQLATDVLLEPLLP